MREQTDSLRNELMDYNATAETIRNLEALVASLTELLDVQEKVVGEQSERLKQNEEALRESEERFRTILHSMQFGIVIIDAQTHTILDANEKALEMIKGGTDVIVGSVCHRFICPAESGKCPVTDLGQTVDSSERILITSQGEKIPILKSVIPTILSGKKVLIESFIDITERKRAEEALRESDDRFLAFIKEAAMRLKNPLEVVEENLAIVMNDIERGESEPKTVSLELRIQLKNLEQIRKNIIELNQVIVDHSGELSDASKKFLTG
jgi:PAS domain-containing protein